MGWLKSFRMRTLPLESNSCAPSSFLPITPPTHPSPPHLPPSVSPFFILTFGCTIFRAANSQTHLPITPEVTCTWEIIFPSGQNLKESREHLFVVVATFLHLELWDNVLTAAGKLRKEILDRIYSLGSYHIGGGKTYLEVRRHPNTLAFVFSSFSLCFHQKPWTCMIFLTFSFNRTWFASSCPV